MPPTTMPPTTMPPTTMPPTTMPPTTMPPTTMPPAPYKFKKLPNDINSLPPGLTAGASGSNYTSLGNTSSYEDCEKAALASPDISKIEAITWHPPNFGGDWSKKCYSINNKNNFGKTNGVESGVKQIEPPSIEYKFDKQNDKNCIWGRVPKVYASNDNYNYIGTFNSYDDCEKAALADPNINKIKAVSWHNDKYGEWKGVCYTINDNNTNQIDTNSTCGIKQRTTCRELRDKYDILPGITFGSAPKDVQDLWIANCQNERTTCRELRDKYGILPGITFGTAPQNVQNWWTTNCQNERTTCYELMNKYGIIPGQTFGTAPQNVKDWWSKNCSNIPPTPIVTNFDAPLGEYSSCCNVSCTNDVNSNCNCMMDYIVLYRKTFDGMYYDSLPSNIMGPSNNCHTYWNPTLYFKISNPPNPSNNISIVLLTSKHKENNWYYSDVPPLNLKDTLVNDILNNRIPKFSGATATFGSKYIQNTSPVPIIIPKFIIRAGGSKWAKLIQDGNETTTNIQLSWNPDKQSNDLDYAKVNQIGVQFRYFAEFWLNKTDKKSGSTDVYVGTLSNNLGKYEFSINGTNYTGKFYGSTWSWNYNGDYCFTTNNAQIKDTCMNGWEYQNGMCYASGNASGNASTACSPYSWSGMAAYSGGLDGDMARWVKGCGVSNTSNCKNTPQPRIWFVEWNGEPGSVIIKLGEIQQALHLNIRKDMTIINTLNENNQWGQEDRSITDFHSIIGWGNKIIKNPLSFYIIFMADGFNIVYNGKLIAKFPNRFNVTNSNNLNIFQDKGIKVTEIL
jgi:hypothetical protein